ncbi:MAG: DUF4912 domain-containing protein [Peptococcaceae bacterium]|nr:DUF4912 domain-containing protein [Peptococcaceae bacterium]
MSALSLLFFSALILIVAGVFLWSFRRNRAAKIINPPQPLFTEETAEELGIDVPITTKQQPSMTQDIYLPHNYGMDRMVLLARDPHWLFAYWEVTATKQEEFTGIYGKEAWLSTSPVLRIYDVTGIDFNGNNALNYFDYHMEDNVDSWHIEVGEPDRSFCVDLGRMFPDGRFITLLRSNTVTTPRASLSDCLDEEWMWIEGLYQSIGKVRYGASSPLIIEELGRRKGVLPLGISSPGNWHA